MRTFNYLIMLFGILLMTSCAQFTRYQTGRTLGKGNTMIGGKASLSGVAINQPGLTAFPELGAYIQHGIIEDLDVGLSISSNTSVMGFAKYQFLGDKYSKYAGSLELDVESVIGGNQFYDGTYPLRYGISAPLSMHQGNFAYILQPQYLNQQIVNDNTSSHFLGSTFGYYKETQKRFDFSLGLTYMFVYNQNFVKTNENFYQAGLVFHFKSKRMRQSALDDY